MNQAPPGDTGSHDPTPDNCCGCDRRPAAPGFGWCAACLADRRAGVVAPEPARTRIYVPQVDAADIRARIRRAIIG